MCGLSTLTMMVQMTILRQLDAGVPGPIALATVVTLYLAIVGLGRRHAEPEPWRPAARLLGGAAIVYFSTLVAIMAASSPETHRSASRHQA